jgi:2-methylcitrate dehydratase
MSSPTVSERLAEYTLNLQYADLTPAAIAEAKHMILDVLGVALVGTLGRPVRILRELLLDVGGPEEATVVGGGRKIWCANAALANGMALRHPEYCGHLNTPDTLIAIHCEENVPAALAICEKLGLSGRDLILATVLGAELFGRFGMVTDMEHEVGIRHTTVSIFTVPLLAGKLLGLTKAQLIHAFGISGSFGLTLHECHSGPHVSSVRDMVYGLGAHHGIRAALLAQRGFDGPAAIYEGKWGFLNALGAEGVRGRARLSKMFQERDEFLITNYGYKLKVGDGTVQSPGDAILELKRAHGIDHRDVAAIKVYLPRVLAEYDTASEPRRRPINKSDADHSLYYTVARALIDGDLQYPEQFTVEKLDDTAVQALMDKIRVYVDLKMRTERTHPQANISYVEVHLRDGTVHATRKEFVDGYGPLKSHEKVVASYRKLAQKRLQPDVAQSVLDTVLTLDALDDVGTLMDLVRHV